MQQQNEPIKRSSGWNKLRSIFLKNKTVSISNSNEEFWSNLFIKSLQTSTKSNESFTVYTFTNTLEDNQPLSIKIKNQQTELSLKEVIQSNSEKIDNTGLIQWPGEEILAAIINKFFLQKKLYLYNRIIELGAGFNGLAGITLALLSSHNKIEQNSNTQISDDKKYQYLTDGNEQCIKHLKYNMDLNLLNFDCLNAAKQMFGDYKEFLTMECQDKKFEFMIMADVLFFREYQESLQDCIEGLVEEDKGLCWIVAPDRDGTLGLFEERLKKRVDLERMNYNKYDCREMLGIGSKEVGKIVYLLEIRVKRI